MEEGTNGILLKTEGFEERCPYRNLVESLMYLYQGTRPDLIFAINILSRFNTSYKQEHWRAAKRLLRQEITQITQRDSELQTEIWTTILSILLATQLRGFPKHLSMIRDQWLVIYLFHVEDLSRGQRTGQLLLQSPVPKLIICPLCQSREKQSVYITFVMNCA